MLYFGIQEWRCEAFACLVCGVLAVRGFRDLMKVFNLLRCVILWLCLRLGVGCFALVLC